MIPTTKLIVDSWAWLELFTGSGRGRTVEEKIGHALPFTSAVTLAEVVSVASRRGRPMDKEVSGIRSLSKVVPPTSDDAIEAGILHATTRKSSANFSLADAFVLQLARKLGGKVLTGDPDFREIKEAELI